MNISINAKVTILLLTMFFGSILSGNAQNNNAAIANADSTHFSVNKGGSWLLYNSYASAYTADSARLELIIQQDSVINWEEDQYIGMIKGVTLRPLSDREVSLMLLPNTYMVRIEPSGKCYIKQTSGLPPSSVPVVLPITIQYKL